MPMLCVIVVIKCRLQGVAIHAVLIMDIHLHVESHVAANAHKQSSGGQMASVQAQAILRLITLPLHTLYYAPIS